MANDCGGECCHLNHLQHDDGSCCRHESSRVSVLLPRDRRAQVAKLAKREEITVSAWVRKALETFRETPELAIAEDAECVSLEVTLPLYLVRWIRARDSRYVARRVESFFAEESPVS